MRWLKVIPSGSCDSIIFNIVRIGNSINTLKLVGVDIFHRILV